MAERDEPPPGLGAEPVALQESPRVIDDPELPHASHGKSGIAWLDLSLAIAVLALSAASLLTAQHSGRTMEKLVEENSRLVRANSTPVLQFLSGNVGDNGRAISLSVANVGTGTARVIWFEITMMGLAKTDPIDLIDYAPRAEEQDYLPTRPVGGTYFPAGETRQFLTWNYPKSAVSQAKWNAFDAARSELKVTACYCSVLGECWTSHLAADVPEPVPQCSAKGHLNFAESPPAPRLPIAK